MVECRRLGIASLTLYTFSKENWSRPRDEVAFLFDLLVRFLGRELKTLLDNDVQLRVLGELSDLPLPTRKAVRHCMQKTAHCSSMILNLALNYSGRHELVLAVRAVVADGMDPDQVDEAALSQRLYTAGQPDPDLVIRTSGELRLSNFLLFQSAYAELYFTDTLWPDFDASELRKALEDYASRRRRFGKTDEQVGPES